jgi:pseudaminic acid synthase
MNRLEQVIMLPSGRRIGAGQPCFIVAELSGNHNGRLERALDLVRAAKDAGADAVKLQTYTADTLTIDSDRPFFRIVGNNAWAGRTLYNLYQEASTPWEWHGALFAEARRLGMEVFSTPFDASAVDFLESLGASLHKIASFEMVDLELIARVAATGKPVLMSTGMASEKEIREAVEAFTAAGNRQLILLKCTSAYPAPPTEMNIRAVPLLAARFGVPVGLSDHSLSERATVAAVALGACVIEKHLTLARADGGPDASFSLEPAELRRTVEIVRETEQVLGRAELGPGSAESSSVVFRRSIFVVRDIAAGETLTRENIRVIRPGHGLAPKYLAKVMGRRAQLALARGTPLTWDAVEGGPPNIGAACVKLVPLGEEHTDLILRWRHDPVVAHELFSPRPPTRAGHLAWLKTLGEARREYVIVSLPDETPVGTIGLSQIDRHHLTAEYGVLLGQATYRGRGLARAASEAILRIAFEELGLHRLTLRVFADNAAALRLYERIGFCREGVLREHALGEAAYRDVVVMGILESEWRAVAYPS